MSSYSHSSLRSSSGTSPSVSGHPSNMKRTDFKTLSSKQIFFFRVERRERRTRLRDGSFSHEALVTSASCVRPVEVDTASLLHALSLRACKPTCDCSRRLATVDLDREFSTAPIAIIIIKSGAIPRATAARNGSNPIVSPGTQLPEAEFSSEQCDAPSASSSSGPKSTSTEATRTTSQTAFLSNVQIISCNVLLYEAMSK
mmetsp:Transcript_18249/g.43947  ORF Transcript_18249/g.43947 Transcript_18249/m.43947 type:complete len:200 (-) Transcript_18249:130-729(-)